MNITNGNALVQIVIYLNTKLQMKDCTQRCTIRQNLQERLAHLKYLKQIGFQTGSGNLIGLPNQTLDDIADDILLCKEYNCDMCSFSPFIPSPDTPFNKISQADLDLTLKTMAVARIVLKDVHIPATTALSTLTEEGRKLGLTVGANVIMPNFTPDEHKEKYKDLRK